MAFVNAEDRYGMLEIVIFPNVYENIPPSSVQAVRCCSVELLI